MAKIGDLIRSLREEKGVTAKDLAERIGLSASQMSRLESGQRRVNSEVLARIARALEVTPSELFEEGSPGSVRPLSSSAATPLRQALGKVIRSARRQKHWTIEDLARKTSTSRAFCLSVEEGRRSGMESDFIKKACRLLGFSPLDLLASAEEKLDVSETEPPTSEAGSSSLVHGIPLLAADVSAYPEELDDQGKPSGVVEQWLQLPGIDPDRSFAVRVAGDAMAGPGEDCFRNGDVIVLSLDEAVSSGSYALVRTLWKSSEAPEFATRTIFCGYFDDDHEARRLQFLRPEYPPFILPTSEVVHAWKVLLHLRIPANPGSHP
ncbi:MAG: helix-turn-helix domain-containing protein [Planctomycetota bacterium]